MSFHRMRRVGAFLAGAAFTALATATAQAGDKVISLWDLQTMPNAVKVIRDAADRFEASHSGYKIEDTHVLNDAYKTKIKIAFGAKDPPCVFSSWGGGPLREYVRADQVVDLTPYLDRDPAFRDRFLPASFTAATVGGKIYALPAENTSIAVIYYNKEIFQKLGLAPPATWDELLKVVDALKSSSIAPFALANKAKWPGSMYYGYLVDRIGGPEVFEKAAQRKAGGSFKDPAFVEAGKYLQDLVKLGAFQKGYNGLDYDIGGSRRLLYSGKAAMVGIRCCKASPAMRARFAKFGPFDVTIRPSTPWAVSSANRGDNSSSVVAKAALFRPMPRSPAARSIAGCHI